MQVTSNSIPTILDDFKMQIDNSVDNKQPSTSKNSNAQTSQSL